MHSFICSVKLLSKNSNISKLTSFWYPLLKEPFKHAKSFSLTSSTKPILLYNPCYPSLLSTVQTSVKESVTNKKNSPNITLIAWLKKEISGSSKMIIKKIKNFTSNISTTLSIFPMRKNKNKSSSSWNSKILDKAISMWGKE